MTLAASGSCFHCGNPVPAGTAYAVSVRGLAQPVCCGGCEAAANLVLAQGLERFYEFRDIGARVPDDNHRDWLVYDREEALRRYTHLRTDGRRELSLQVEGMHCAACAWLIENSVRALDGIVDIQVNPSNARAELQLDPGRVSLSQVLERIHHLGYRPQPLSFTAGDAPWLVERRAALTRLAVAGLGMMQVMTYAVSLYVGAMEGIAPDLAQLLRFVSLLVTTPVLLFAAQPFFVAAWRGLRMRTLVMDLPVALSIGGAYGWSVWATLRGWGPVYFDSVVMFTFFLLLGRYVEMSLRHGFGLHHDAIARLLPESTLRISGLQEERVIPDELRAGDRVRILPGERVPADGEILSGRTEVDESLLTGESLPNLRTLGDTLIAGTLNLMSAVDLKVTGVGQDSTLAAVSRLLEHARVLRPRIADVADHVAAWFVGAVLLLAAGVGIYWLHADASRALTTVLAVLVVTCPCALSLATPAALAAASTRMAGLGLLVTSGRALDTLARADLIVFDKTGTLTRGQLGMEEVRVLRDSGSAARCTEIAAALERYSEHPIARAFAGKASAIAITDVSTTVGAGIEGRLDDTRYRIGRADYVLDICASRTAVEIPPVRDTRPSVFLGDSDGLLAEFVLGDELRADSKVTVEKLRGLGLEPQIASGDRAPVVAAVARQLGGLPAVGDMRPFDKVARVHSLQESGHIVAMVGDGVNDAPVLAAANVSVALGSGTDLAKVSADVVLLGGSLAPLVTGVETARRCMRVIRQNMTWAIVYNAVAVPLAASGWLQPWMAAVGMSSSSLLVVLNAMRLLERPARRIAARAPQTVSAPRIAAI